MTQTFLQLGFKRFIISSTTFQGVVPARSWRVGAFVSFNVRAMSSERRVSSSARPVSPIVEKSVVKDKAVENKVCDIQSIKDDPEKIESMTVLELRNILRTVGVSAKGRKSDLISSLKCFVETKTDSESVTQQNEKVTMKRKAETLASGDSNEHTVSISETSSLRQSKRKGKQSLPQNTTVKVVAKIAKTIEKVSNKTDETSGVSKLLVNQAEPWTVLAHIKPQKDWIAYNPRTMRPPPLDKDTKSVKLMSWNVNGLRALLKLEGFSALQLAQREDFDVLCLQETKIQEKDVEAIKQTLIEGYDNTYWSCSVSKLGYSGTAIISREVILLQQKPLSVRYGLGISDHDSEGRLVTAEFDSFYLISSYVPNSGDGLKRLSYRINEWDSSLGMYIKELEKSKPVVLTGDLNCAHEEIDIYNPAGNKRSAGFTIEERQSFGENFLSKGFVDTFRKQHPGAVGYTYWGYRHGGRKTNKGWRLDYFLVSESIVDNVHDSYILPDIGGSDHCPIGLVLKL
ncbi:hypothetical protein ACFE04_030524 [Oxalis oulophora]